MIQESIVIEGVYFTHSGFEISPAELRAQVARGPVAVFNETGKFIGDVLQVRRVDSCLEALIEI